MHQALKPTDTNKNAAFPVTAAAFGVNSFQVSCFFYYNVRMSRAYFGDSFEEFAYSRAKQKESPSYFLLKIDFCRA